jgi:hypothetical protein
MRKSLFLILAAWMLMGCPSEEEPDEPETLPEADLSAFERRRAASAGAAVEQAVRDERSAAARTVYASTEDQPTLIDLENAGATPPGLGAKDDSNTAGSSAPTDLDRASEEVGAWIDMDLVGRTIRGQQRALKSCWQAERGTGTERRVDVRLTVNVRGQCMDARIARSSPVTGRNLERCLQGVLKKAKFPEAQDGDKTFSYVLRF